MILVDTNVFQVAAGKPSPQRAPCRRFLDRMVRGNAEVAARTDAEFLQEILHRYRVIAAADTGTALFDAVLSHDRGFDGLAGIERLEP